MVHKNILVWGSRTTTILIWISLLSSWLDREFPLSRGLKKKKHISINSNGQPNWSYWKGKKKVEHAIRDLFLINQSFFPPPILFPLNVHFRQGAVSHNVSHHWELSAHFCKEVAPHERYLSVYMVKENILGLFQRQPQYKFCSTDK